MRYADKVAKVVDAQGFRVKRTRHGYIAYAKDPALGTVGWHSSPSDNRANKNLVADLRRIGADWP